ncbi:MAG: hypothetical protein EPN82_06765 [Bacteroidetes bacterium]|nr:MAG: hypothetical protein EPN82_06765 [Bacteroidota bacterium]
MDDELKKAVQKTKAAAQSAFPTERNSFKSLLIGNPNYFGNLAESPYKPIISITYNTHYEDLACLGYHPQQQKLEAVVYILQPTGYGTDICGSGTSEYVRFYISYDNGATWFDQGMTSFQVYNIPEGTEGGKRLEYAASIHINPKRKFCILDPLIKARAILSWNNPPPPNQPNWIPVWGNVRNSTIQVEPFKFIPLPPIFEAAKVKIPPILEEVLDLEQPLETLKKEYNASQLAVMYKDKGVPVHRFALKEMLSFISGKTSVSAEAFTKLIPDIQINPNIGDLLFPKTDGDISYEELKCIGLDPNHPDSLVGVIQVKKSSGYSGGPCTKGSKEYVSFWADFDGNGSFETFLGTADVTTYDIVQITSEGIYYAVRLPVDLEKFRRHCKKGPVVVRIRAILSWNIAPPGFNPNYVPTWGNREETLININPIAGVAAGKIAIMGGIPVSFIDNITGLTTPDAKFATNNLPPDDPDGNAATPGRPCPFARRVTIQGAPIPGYSYIVEVSPDGLVWTPVLTDLLVTDQFGFTSTHKANPVTKRFSYLPFNQNIISLLAQWDTSGNAKWHVRLLTYDAIGNLAGVDNHVIQLENTGPHAFIDITSGAGSCGKFKIKDIISGTFVARSENNYLGRYSIYIEPSINPPGIGVPVPSSGLFNTAIAPGNPWTLNTAKMKPCGYVIRVDAVDRSIVNSQAVGLWASFSDGFCLEEKLEP